LRVPIYKVVRRNDFLNPSLRRIRFPDLYELSGIEKRQWAQENGVDDAEYRGICPDSQSQHENRDHKETRIVAELPRGIPQIFR